MSVVKNGHDIESVKKEFDELLNNLSGILQEVKSRTNINSTKLAKIKKDLADFETLDLESQGKLIEIATKYNFINAIFKSNVCYNKKDLAKIIEGKHDYTADSNDRYNDWFFEISMAVRFLLASQKHFNSNVEINLDSDCDIILDKFIAIECKYIHSTSNLLKNIKKAKEQIEKRVESKQAELGFIAIDLSHVYAKDNMKNFIDDLMERFLKNYNKINENKIINLNDIESHIANDSNFNNIVRCYLTHELETLMHSHIGFSFDMGDKVLAIIYQAKLSIPIKNGRYIIHRGLSYILNRKLDQNTATSTEILIHSLAVGI